ncbi:LSU ribosomal protein L24P [Natronoarchaeum philippinense]|uniref:Large ribosomal subunit protein uL24 n=1 Tax=Natronoarchaeum philippinense TaxID=558529 RepID=A0A285NBX5_NATPI|nr:50S ribosomal protein L24 [Natronoarchaeum philippinense]SNZ06919.1 LSU ribosomal protein L24P [Natronoarchaeum philippinense]
MTRQPRKQRNQTDNAPLHERHKQVHATLSGDLREEFDRRRARVNAGDTVEVMRGDYAGEEAEVVEVNLKDGVVHVEDVTLEKADGEEVPRPLDASNLRITDLDLEDDRREDRLRGDSE